MKLIVGPQCHSSGSFMDHFCDFCKKDTSSEELISIDTKWGNQEEHRRKRQLVTCPFCLGKLVKASEDYLGNLIVGAKEKEEIVKL